MIRKKKKGFTIIELIIVIAIIAILSAITIPKFGDIRESANEKSDIANAKTIATVTTSLIADGEITPEKNKNLTIELNDEGNSDAEKIRNYLQVVPKLSNKDGDFTISIETNGNVSVSSSVDKKKLFPDETE
ncbi:prepilin-type N-terminal cleavage/methylation domain-containing protein [Clostridium nigeriense]|uniref:prepilin-type N-terminal cleavage/methylation domain-containing protein n=1 Tax=Clostridium nigeriense TaxID=1805470 RepID=UPI003D350548